MPLTRRPWPYHANLYFFCAVAAAFLLQGLQARWGLAGVALTHLVVFVALPLALAHHVGAPLRAVFRLRPVGLAAVGVSALLGAAAWAAAQALAALSLYLAGQAGLRPPNPYRGLLEAPLPPWQIWLAVAAMPAVTEELAFRGLVLSGLAPLGRRAAPVVAGLLFALMHLSLLRLPALALLGITLSLAAQRTGSLLPGAMIHLTNNALSLGQYWLAVRVQGQPVPADLAVPAQALAFWLPVGAAALAAVPALLRRLPPAPDGEAPAGAGAPPAPGAGVAPAPGGTAPAATRPADRAARLALLVLHWWPLPLALALVAALTWALELAPALRPR